MDHSHLLQIFLVFLLIFSITCGQQLTYDELDSDESEEQEKSLTKMSDRFDYNNEESDETKISQQRSILSHSTKDRHHLIALLRKAYSEGWKPNLIHYIPATRFGRHL